MKVLARGFFGTLGVACCLLQFSPSTAWAQQVTVMQWNVHGNLGTATAQAGVEAAAIARILNYLQPDVLLLNEVADGDVATNTVALTQWISANLPYLAGGSFSVAVSTEPPNTQRNAAVSRYPILSPFTYPDVSSGLRGLFSFDLQLAGTNRLHIFHVHLKCCGDAASCQTKQDEAQLFTNNIATWAATNSTPYLLAGDFNEDDANPECPGYLTISTLRNGAQLGEFMPTTLSGEYRTWSTAPATPSIRFDYILAATNRLNPDSGFVFSTMDWAAHGQYTNVSPQNLANDSQTASDHYGVVAAYTLSTNPPMPLQNLQTVFVIPMENQNWASVKGSSSAPYVNNTLLPSGAHAEQYFNPPGQHPSLPNYLWLEAGTNFGITSDILPATGHQNTTNHLVTLLKNAGITWRSYNEDICGCDCPLANTNLYVPRHNPFVYFDDVTNTNSASSAACRSNIRAYSQLAGDLASNTVARYNWVVPNLCDDMHNTSPCGTTDPIKNGDTWLANNLPAILSSPAYLNHGAVFIVWDEGAGSSDGPVGMIVLSPLAKPGYANSVHYTHSSTLRTMQEIFNVGSLLGDAANATNLSDLFNFGPQLSVSPPTGLTATGTMGGLFTPASQTYTLTNIGGATLTWTASVSSNWLTLSAAGGTLAAGASTSVTISLNTNANNLPAGNYFDTLSFLNTAGGAGNTTRAVSLTVNIPGAQLAVSPAGGFSSAGPPGGAFNPGSQNYTLSNPGSAALNWTASNSANWLSVSPAGGTLAAGTSTNLTVSITPNANALTAGTYSDTVSITNTTTGTGSTTRTVTLTVSSFGFFDDFSFLTPGNLVGQQNWVQVTGIATQPLQVGGGQVVIPFGQSVDNQDAYKNFTTTNGTIFYGLALTITNAPVTSTPSYFAALYTSNNAAGFANYRLTAKDNGSGTCVLGLRITGQAGNPYTFGASGLSYGTALRVIVEADSGGSVMKLFVNPTSANLAAQILYASNSIGSGTPPTQVGSFVMSQFASGAAPNVGVAIGKVVVADNFATVYSALTPALTPFQTWQLQYFGSTNSPSAAPAADPDGDGMSNLAEFFAGTNPTNNASALRILGATQESNNLRITWSTAGGRTNVLQAAPALTATFTNVSPNLILSGSGDTVTNYLDPGAVSASAARFYRVYLVP